jgi:hypothetical protein
VHDRPTDIRQPVVAALKANCQLRMLDSEQMQKRCLQIVHVDWVLDDVVRKVIRKTVSESSLYASPG